MDLSGLQFWFNVSFSLQWISCQRKWKWQKTKERKRQRRWEKEEQERKRRVWGGRIDHLIPSACVSHWRWNEILPITGKIKKMKFILDNCVINNYSHILWFHFRLIFIGCWMACFPVRKWLEWNSGRWNGSRKDHPMYRFLRLLARERSLRTFLGYGSSFNAWKLVQRGAAVNWTNFQKS